MGTFGKLSRRAFLKTAGLAGSGLVIGFRLSGRWAEAAGATTAGRAASTYAPNAFLRIAKDGSITVLAKHSEMGQGVYTSLAMVIAEELEADWRTIRVEAAPAHPDYNHTQWGMQGTGGSTSTLESFDQMRRAGATAKAMLIAAAAKLWRVDPATCRAENGMVLHQGGKRVSYGRLAEQAAKIPPPAQVALKDPKDFRLIGKPTRRLDTPAKVTGRGVFGIDVKLPGLLTASVNAPFSEPKSSVSRMLSGNPAQLRATKGRPLLCDTAWAERATSSFPVPLSPCSRSGESDGL